MTERPTGSGPDLAPKHVRAARALLAWSQQDLAKAASVAISTVADFERGQRKPVANNAEAIRGALEGAGIRFLPTGAIIGPAVPAVFTSGRPGMPVRWVNAEDLADWANRTEAAVSFPTLVAHLVRASHGAAATLRFPADEGVRHSGWDGVTMTETGSLYVPKGAAGWELGVQRSKILQKATEEYQKRTDKPGQLDPADATFVFVTLRHWPKKDEWAKQRQSEGPWRDVRVYDADDLVHWIELTPAVGLWLARRLDKRPAGTRELDEVWEEWSRATELPLTEDLVLSDRDEDVATVLRWLRGVPSVLDLQATTADEVVAFFHAALSELPDEHSQAYRSRCLVATTSDAARTLSAAQAPLILLLTEPDPGLARTLAQRGHYVLQAYDERYSPDSGRILARPSREGIASALEGAGFPDEQANRLARDCARNLTVLRRLIPPAPGRRPVWAEQQPSRALVAALLAGGWDEQNAADKGCLSELAGVPYETIIDELTCYVGDLDTPLQKIGPAWRMTSPRDAWTLLAPRLTKASLDRFEACAYAVLGSADPRFDLDPNERWMAAVHQVHPRFSGMLRHGIGQVLVSLAIWGALVRTVDGVEERSQAIVHKLLHGADRRRWWSLSGDFRLLAEAAPQAFLDAIEHSLDQDDPPISVLFGRDEGSIEGAEYLADLMWALETLAWSPELLARVSHVLARLIALDTKPRRMVNGPGHSLGAIYLLGLPQTYATLSQRLEVLDKIRKRHPEAAWGLLMGMLPKGSTVTVSPTPKPRWRDVSVEKVEPVTHALFRHGALAVSDRLLEHVGLRADRWSDLLSHIDDLWPGPERALDMLDAAESQVTDEAERLVFWGTLRHVLHRHRQFPDAEWSLPEVNLARLEAAYKRFAPRSILARTAWLFRHDVELPDVPDDAEGSWEAEQRQVSAAQQAGAQQLYAEGGTPAVLALAQQVEVPGLIGKAMYDCGLPAGDLDALLAAALCSDSEQERLVGRGLICSILPDRKEQWVTSLVERAKAECWGDPALQMIMGSLPPEPWVWALAAEIGGEPEQAFWRRVPSFWKSENVEEITFAVRKLIDLGNPRQALGILGRASKADLPSDLLVELLTEAVCQPLEENADRNELRLFQHFVTQILKTLDERNDVRSEDLALLEWRYLPLLEHSRRPAKALMKALSEDPAFFVQMLSAVFRASEESGVTDTEPDNPVHARAAANQAYRLLELWSRIPGTQDNGVIDGDALEAWIKEARSLAKAAGREGVADSRIGAVLSASPMGADDQWPAEPVRDMLELFHGSHSMINGFIIGKMNRRGVTSRMPQDGGALERREAAKYRGWAEAVGDDHPCTARALEALAKSYERDALRHDESARRLDWEG